MNPMMIPGFPSGGLMSKVALIGPSSLIVWPLRPLARQNGLE